MAVEKQVSITYIDNFLSKIVLADSVVKIGLKVLALCDFKTQKMIWYVPVGRSKW